MADLQLLTSRYSPFGQRVHLALVEKKIPCQVEYVNLSEKPEILLKANPIYKKIPTVIHNGNAIPESIVILEYLEEAFPDHSPLMPKDPYKRSLARFWTDYIYKSFANFSEAFTTKPGTPEKEAVNAKILESWKMLDTAMTKFSAEGPFFVGDKFGYLDVVLAPLSNGVILLERLGGVQIPGPDELPRLHKWMETTREYPSVKEALPSEEDSFTFMKALFERRAAAAAAAAK
ncbi:unnamed protein product [Calypogeia fissa]